ncbi:MAG: carboxypeptidase-like regulatory domain-containing protein [Planctomycetes bacterium]|nr:carboxypeptidase-like regulatory domain-containing protein [Planctomycetota bacterium]
MLLVLLALLAGFLAITLNPNPDIAGSPSTQPDTRSQRAETGTEPLHGPVSEDVLKHVEPAAQAAEAEQVVGQDQLQQTAELVLRFVDASDTPIPFADFSYAALTMGDYGRLDRRNVSDPLTQHDQSDVNGQWTTTGPTMGLLFIRMADEQWTWLAPRGKQFRWLPNDPNVAVLRTNRDKTQEFRIRLAQAQYCSLTVIYADGQPYEGNVGVGHFTNDKRTMLMGQGFSDLPYSVGMGIMAYPSTWLRIAVHSVRAGFREYTNAMPEPEDLNGGQLTVVIEEDPNRREPGGLILDHSSFPPAQSMMAVVVSPGGGFMGNTLELVGPGETRTDQFPTPIKLWCIAAGAGVVWSTGLVELEPGEWERVKVEPMKPAEITLLVQDEHGDPVSDAIVSIQAAGFADWSWLDTSRAVDDGGISAPSARQDLLSITERLNRARSDGNGRVRFKAAWPGKRQLIVQALGYEPEMIDVDAIQGRNVDLGVVALTKASAGITVKITVGESDDPTQFTLSLFARTHRVHKDRVPFDAEGVAELEHLPAGRYQVFVSPLKRGGAGHFKRIELVPGDRREVTIDMTRPPGLQED